MKQTLSPSQKRNAVLEVAKKLDVCPTETAFHKVFIKSDSEYIKLILDKPYEEKGIIL